MVFRVRAVAALLLAGVLVAGCTAGGDDDTGGSASIDVSAAAAEAAKPTPWTDAIDAFDPEGPPNVDAALSLFAMAFGPIEGAPEPSADSGAGGDVTVAYRAVLGVWDQLTPDQRAAVDAALVVPEESSQTRQAGFLPMPRAAAAKPDPALVDAVTTAAADLRADIAGRIGDFKGSLTVVVGTKNDAASDLAFTYPKLRADGSFTGDCTVTLLPIAETKGAETVLNTLAHEVFHCFQLAAYGNVSRYAGAPKWVVEGGAEWVAATITTPDSTTSGRWSAWLQVPELPLQQKAYSAIGFWSHLDEAGTEPWSVFRQVWAVGGTPAAFAAAGATAPGFLETWASGFSRDPARGPAWDTDGPGITNDAATPAKLVVPADGTGTAAAVSYANGLHVVDSAADVLVFAATGTVRLSVGAIDTTQIDGSRFCLRAGGCTCPDVPDDIPPPPLTEPPLVAITGGPTGSSVTITGLRLDLHCKEKEKEKQAGPVQVVADRPASEGVLAGRVLELTSCNGAYGDWAGVIRLGGLSLDGFEVPFQELPLEFTVGGSGTQTVPAAVSGVIATPVFDLAVSYDMSVTVDGSTMSITGTGTGDTGIVSVAPPLPPQLVGMPITPAPAGACP